jgi:RNA polymerase sigma-70 factor (ECF subfamily)
MLPLGIDGSDGEGGALAGRELQLTLVGCIVLNVAVTNQRLALRDDVTITRDRVDEQALLAAARSDAASFSAFYRHFERPVLLFFMHATGRADLAADLAAETFASALESVAGYDSGRGRADQWLFGIARNVLGTSYRRGRVDAAARERLGMPRLILDDHATDIISRLCAADQATLAVAELPPEQRRAVEARVLDERAYADIARELDCSEAVVRQRVSRGLRALRTRLAGEK